MNTSTPLSSPYTRHSGWMLRIFHRLAVLCALLGLSQPAAADIFTFYPDQVLWQCLPGPTGDTRCALAVVGPKPPGAGQDARLYAWVRVRRGPTYGIGVNLASMIVELDCIDAVSLLYCTKQDVAILGPNVQYVVGFDNRPNLNIYLAGAPPAPAFDWDGDGAITADREGLMLTRFLAGMSPSAVSQGIPLSQGRTPTSVYDAIAAGVKLGWFRFSNTVDPVVTRDAVMFVRCLRGIRGAALVAGFPNADAANAGNACDSVLATQ